MKRCIKCDVELNSENQYEYAKKNYIHKCKECLNDEKKIFARGIPNERKNTISKKYIENRRLNNPKKHSASNMSGSSKKRAKKKGIPHDIDTAYILSIMPDSCPVFNVKLKYGKGGKEKYSASLDRIEPDKGYVKGNVQILSMLANLMKSNADEQELEMFSKWIQNKKRITK